MAWEVETCGKDLYPKYLCSQVVFLCQGKTGKVHISSHHRHKASNTLHSTWKYMCTIMVEAFRRFFSTPWHFPWQSKDRLDPLIPLAHWSRNREYCSPLQVSDGEMVARVGFEPCRRLIPGVRHYYCVGPCECKHVHVFMSCIFFSFFFTTTVFTLHHWLWL